MVQIEIVMRKTDNIGTEAILKVKPMTTEEIIILIFCAVDDGLGNVPKERNARLYPSEVIIIGILFALKGERFRAFYRWLKRDWDGLFGGLPDRTALQRQLRRHEARADQLLADPSLLNVMDSFPIELVFPIRAGRSAHQIGTKNRDKGRWSIGLKLCWVLNHVGQVVGWHWLPMNHSDQDFLPLVDLIAADGLVLTDLGFRCKAGMPDNLESYDKSKPYLVHCGGGYRSMMAISLMKKQGFKNLLNIYGGFSAMQQAGMEVVTEEIVV